MKALVTGASGFIGSTLIRLLNQEGIEVVALMRKSSSDANLKGLQYTRVEGDVRDYDSLCRAVVGCDYVFHLAGLVAAKDREQYFQFNSLGTENLARACVEHAPGLKRFVFVSSLAAGGPSPSAVPRTEVDTDAPVSAYGESKLDAEKRLLRFSSKFPIAIVRPPMVYGPRDTAFFLLIKTVSRKIIPLVSANTPDGQKYYSMIHALDLCEAILRAGRHESAARKSGEIFYVSSGEIVSYDSLMSTIARCLGVKPMKLRVPFQFLNFTAQVLTLASRATGAHFMLNRDKINEIRPDYWTCSSDKARDVLGFEPEYFLANGMKDAVDWYRANHWV